MKLYHGTIASYLPSIERQGLLPRARPGNDANWHYAGRWQTPGRDGSVFVSTNERTASDFAERLAINNRDKPVLLELNIPAKDADANLHNDEAAGSIYDHELLRYQGAIKPEWIKGARELEPSLSGLLAALVN